jgi:hypothetical protein
MWKYYYTSSSRNRFEIKFEIKSQSGLHNVTYMCDFNTQKSDFYTQSVISPCSVSFPHAECDFVTYKCGYDTHECDYYTYECDNDTHGCDLHTHKLNFNTICVTLKRTK